MNSNGDTDAGNGGSAGTPCRFCGHRPDPGQHRVSGPEGPICIDCIETGLRLTTSRKPDFDDTTMRRLDTADDAVCEFCENSVRLSFLGFRRSLPRAVSTSSGAVICAGCLDWAGNLINRALSG